MSDRYALRVEVETRVRIAERRGWTNRNVPVRLLRQIVEELGTERAEGHRSAAQEKPEVK